MPLLNGVLYSINDLMSPFKCNVEICKGACCFIEGEFGAPLKPSEVKIIEQSLPVIWDLLPETSKNVIKSKGWLIKSNGKLYTNVVNNKECVFAFFENQIARCAFEKAFLERKITFRKPISCHLFPLREYSFFFTELVYVKIPECQTAIENGEKTSTPLIRSVQDALIRRFGTQWFNNLERSLPKLELINEDILSRGGK
jgi:hypothetical protein